MARGPDRGRRRGSHHGAGRRPMISPNMILPGATIGILGGGQLGRMLAGAAARLCYRSHIFTPEVDSPAGLATPFTTIAAFDDEAALARFAAAVDIVTFE